MAQIRKRVATRALVSMVAVGTVATVLGLVVVPTLAATPGSGGSAGSARLQHAVAPVSHVGAVVSCSAPTCYNVLNFGANPDGVADNTAAFQAAIKAAQTNATGGVVYVPTGTYAFTALLNGRYSINIAPPATGATPQPVTLEGDGPNSSILVEHVGEQPLLGVGADGSMVVGLTLNARSYGGGPDVTVAGNNMTITQDTIIGAHKTGVIGAGGHSPIALYFPGPPGASGGNPSYDTGNTVSDTTIEDGINNDGFSFSFQKNGVISNIHHFGSRLALYIDENVTVTNYTYTPNSECLGAVNGFYIAGGSRDITIKDFTTYGQGGVINGPAVKNPASNVTIDNEQFMSPSGFHMGVGDVNGLTIENSSFNTGNELLLSPPGSSTGITIDNTTIPMVDIARYLGSTYTSLSMTFNGDTFPSVTNPPKPTFVSPLPNAPGPTTFNINGGTWSNVGAGFYNGPASNITYNVTNLAPIPVGLPTIASSGTPPVVGDTLTATNKNWLAGQTPAPTFSYQWYLNGSAISGATTSTITASQSGSYTVVVTATNPTGSTQSTSAPESVGT